MATSTERTSALRAERREAGLCPQCGERPPVDGKARCHQCLEINQARAKAQRNKHILRGKCPDCGAPAERTEITVAAVKRRRFAQKRCVPCRRRRILTS